MPCPRSCYPVYVVDIIQYPLSIIRQPFSRRPARPLTRIVRISPTPAQHIICRGRRGGGLQNTQARILQACYRQRASRLKHLTAEPLSTVTGHHFIALLGLCVIVRPAHHPILCSRPRPRSRTKRPRHKQNHGHNCRWFMPLVHVLLLVGLIMRVGLLPVLILSK